MRSRNRTLQLSVLGTLGLLFSSNSILGAPPPPSGGHPRLFLSETILEAFRQAQNDSGSAVSALIAKCQSAIDEPSTLQSSGYQGFHWSEIASACALAWQVTGDAKYADVGVKVWRALLEDIETLGDKRACLPGVDEATGIASIRRDTGYAIRMIGPHTALAYDWLYDAPGVTDAFRQQTRDCFRHWINFYTRDGYLNDQPGANYHAGYVAAKTLIAVAEAGEDGATSDRFWTEVVDEVFGEQLVRNGLAQDNGGVPSGRYHGALVGGDWPEGWQYGPLSVTEYAFCARALSEHGVDLTPMYAWSSDLTLRAIYGLLPDRSATYTGGDTSIDTYFTDPNGGPLSASVLGPSSDEAAGWARFLEEELGVKDRLLWNAFADVCEVSPANPWDADLPLWFLARGTRNLYVRSSWETDAFWSVFTSAPRVVADHQHLDATDFVFVRGGDGLLVDPSPYGARSTLTSNAMTVDSSVVVGDYLPSQTPWSDADMPIARGTESGVVVARGDISKAFNFTSNPSDIELARRDWVFLPEGEIVTIDRATTPSTDHKAYLRFRTPATLEVASNSPFVARGTVGSSALAIHAVKLVPATSPSLGDITPGGDCGQAFGACRIARVKVGEYSWEVAGPDVLAVHVFDALASNEEAAEVAAIDAPPIDVDPPRNGGVVGASVYRASKQTFVLEPAELPGPGTLTYGVPGSNPSRHIVFDAPVDGSGNTAVAAEADGGRCVVSLTAGAGVKGAPAIFTLSAASDGCEVSEDEDVAPGMVPPGSGGFDRPEGSGGSRSGAGGTGGAGRGGANGGAGAGARAGGSSGRGGEAAGDPGDAVDAGADGGGGASGNGDDGCGCRTISRGGHSGTGGAPVLAGLVLAACRRRFQRKVSRCGS